MSAKRSDALLHKRENGYRSLSAEEKAAMNAYCEEYKTFLDKSRTEREAVRYTVQLAEARGYRPYHRGDALKPGDKIYRVNRDKAVMLAVMGTEPLDKGVNIGAGSITCNYDGANKHATVIEDGAFVGSDTMMVAPVTIGAGALVGAGSTITKDVTPGALALGRARQQEIEGWVAAHPIEKKK